MIPRALLLGFMVATAVAMQPHQLPPRGSIHHKPIAFHKASSRRVLREPKVISKSMPMKEMRMEKSMPLKEMRMEKSMSMKEMRMEKSMPLNEEPIRPTQLVEERQAKALIPVSTPAPIYPGPSPTPSAIHGLKPKSYGYHPAPYHPAPAPYHHPAPPHHPPPYVPHGYPPHYDPEPAHSKVTYPPPPPPHPTPKPYHPPARVYHPTPLPHHKKPVIPAHHLPVPVVAKVHHPAPVAPAHPPVVHPLHPAPYHEPVYPEDHSPKNYAFGYAVKDDYTGDDYSHKESRDGYTTEGEYRVALPDGRVQIVTYHADENGYVADVRYEGEIIPYVPRHPPAHPPYHPPLKPYHPAPHHPKVVVPLPPKVTPAPHPPPPPPKPVVVHTTPKPTERPDRLYFSTPKHVPKPPHPTPTPVPRYGYTPYHPAPRVNPVVHHPAPPVVPHEPPVLHQLKPRPYPVPHHLGHHSPIPKPGYIPTPPPYHGPPQLYPTAYPRPDVYRPKADPYLAAKKAASNIESKAIRRTGGGYGGYVG